jgi:acyl transferase domain-containing protein
MNNLHRNWQSEVYLVSAPSRDELLVRGRELQRFLDGAPDVDAADLAYTLNCSDLGLGDARLAIVATSPAELLRKLVSALHRLAQPETIRLKERSGVYYFDSMLGREGKLAFVFPGVGAQYINMLADLCLHFPEVRAWFDLIDRSSSELGRDYCPSQVIFPPTGVAARAETERRLWLTDCGTEVVFAANQALLGLLTRLELRPDAVVGHSSGEYTALIAAGCLQAGDSRRLIDQLIDLNVVYQRLHDAGQIPGGTLVAVGAANESAVREVVAQSAGKVFLAMDNCPQQLVLCASDAELAPALKALKDQGAICATLPFNLAYHTPLFGPYCDALDDFLGGLEFEPPTVDIYSCVTSQAFPRDPQAVRRIVRDQWSRPVRFRETIETMYESGVRVFVEAGPRGNIVSFIDNILQDRPHLAVPANVPQRSGILQLNHAMGLLAAHGIDMRLDALYAHRSPRRLDLEAGMAESTLAKTRSQEMRLLTGMPVLGDDDIDALRVLTTATPSRDDLETSPEPTAPVNAPVDATAAGQASVRSAVIQRYLATMERFVAVQGDVMLAYLTGATPAPASVRIGPPSAAPPVAATVAAAEAMAPPSLRQPAEWMPVEAADQTPATEFSRDDITKLLLRLVSARTGYPPDMLDPTLNLEADLGIDSIKRVEILGRCTARRAWFATATWRLARR